MEKETKSKKRRGRRAYLQDFHQNEEGSYRYEGAVYVYDGQKKNSSVSFCEQMKVLWISSLVPSLLTILSGFLPVPGMRNTFYIILPWTAGMISLISVIYALIRLQYHGSELREYVYKKTIKALPGRAFLSALFMGICAIGQIYFLVLQGIHHEAGADWGWSVVFMTVLVTDVAFCSYLNRRASSMCYKKA